jgi:hypothetical protein
MYIQFSLNQVGDHDCTVQPVHVQTYALGSSLSYETMRQYLEGFLFDALGKPNTVTDYKAVDAVEYGPLYEVSFLNPFAQIRLVNVMITTNKGKAVNAINQKRFETIFNP